MTTKAELTPEQLLAQKLFREYGEKCKAVEAAEAEVVAAREAKSASVLAIKEQLGSGPFALPSGKIVNIVNREGTYFFKEPSVKKATVVGG